MRKLFHIENDSIVKQNVNYSSKLTVLVEAVERHRDLISVDAWCHQSRRE